MEYFILGAPKSHRLLAENAVGPDEWETYACPAATWHKAGHRRLNDLALEVKHNRRDELIIWTWGAECVLHERLLAEFRACGITGYRLRPATVRFRDGHLAEDYQELIVVGWAGIAPRESGIRIIERCPSCQWKKYSGLREPEHLIDWRQWTGDDFFMVWPLPKFILITARVASLLDRLAVKSYSLGKPATSNLDGFTVGRMSSFTPADVAVKFGTPLGLE